MAAMAISESSAGPQMLLPKAAAPQTTSAINTSARTRVPAISRCVQTVFQRFLLVARGNRSCSAGASVADNPCSAAPLSNTSSHTSFRKTPSHLSHVRPCGRHGSLHEYSDEFSLLHMNTHYYIYRHRESTEVKSRSLSKFLQVRSFLYRSMSNTSAHLLSPEPRRSLTGDSEHPGPQRASLRVVAAGGSKRRTRFLGVHLILPVSAVPLIPLLAGLVTCYAVIRLGAPEHSIGRAPRDDLNDSSYQQRFSVW